MHKFEGHDHGDPGAWEAHIKIEIRDEDEDDAPFATVTVAWGGSQPGSRVLESDKDGKIDTRIGEFRDPTITLRITDVQLAGFQYRPDLNEVSTTLVIEGP